jgi:predicted MFS family arabinose efflux permease
MSPKARAVLALGLAQTMAWGGSYYIPAILAAPMARDLGLTTPTIFAVFSAALLLSALIGPAAGRLIDRNGGHGILMASNLIMSLGLVLMAMAQGFATLCLAWAVMGLAMGIGLYEAGFATLAKLFGAGARGPISGITLFAGFASTVAWPFSTWLEAHYGWRGACLVWAAIMPLLGLPLNGLLLPRRAEAEVAAAAQAAPPGKPPGRLALALLAYVFAVAGFTSAAMAAHLPGMLTMVGASAGTVVLAGALLGPSQVGARLLEIGVLRRWSPLISALLANAAHPIGVALLLVWGAPAAIAFVVLHGGGNGILTIARGTLPLALFGPAGYGGRLGWLAIPARFSAAAAPVLFGVLLEGFGVAAMGFTAALSVLAMLALVVLSRAASATGRR